MEPPGHKVPGPGRRFVAVAEPWEAAAVVDETEDSELRLLEKFKGNVLLPCGIC